MLRRLLIQAAIKAAQNPTIRREAGKIAVQAAEKARPAILKGARRAGELTKAASDEIQYQLSEHSSQKSNKKNPPKK